MGTRPHIEEHVAFTLKGQPTDVIPTPSPPSFQTCPHTHSQEYWSATVPASVCYDVNASCQFYISFCQAVPVSLGSACYGAGVCQIGTNDDGGTFGYNMGQFNNNYTQFYESKCHYLDHSIFCFQSSLTLFLDVQVVDGGFHMDVENGSRPDDGRCNKYGIRTRVVLVCNSSANWDNQDLSAFTYVSYAKTEDPCHVS